MFKQIKNWLGSVKGFVTCPNCGDSYWWKPTSIIWYSSGRGLSICTECYNNPVNLNINQIKHSLYKYHWDWKNVEAVGTALIKFKEESEHETKKNKQEKEVSTDQKNNLQH